jgi:hypothetical protein
VGFEIVFETLKDKFHGDFIPNWCHSTMLSKVFQGRTKPNHNQEPLQVQVNNAKAPYYIKRSKLFHEPKA